MKSFFADIWLRWLLLLLPGLLASGSLENNPLRVGDLFRAELQIRNLLEELRRSVDPGWEMQGHVDRFFSSHDLAMETVLETLRLNNITSTAQLQAMGRKGSDLLEAGLVGNPLHVFGLIRRCLHSVDEIARFLEDRVEAKEKEEERRRQEKEEVVIDLDALSEDEEKDPILLFGDRLLREINRVRDGTHWPTTEDLSLAALAIARIQFVYQIDVSDLMSGVLSGRPTSARLSADDARLIARERATSSGSFPMAFPKERPELAAAVEWMEGAYRNSLLQYGEEDDALAEEIHAQLVNIRQQHDESFEEAESSGDLPTSHPNEMLFHRRLGEDLAVSGRGLRREEEAEAGRERERDDAQGNFLALCRGEALRGEDLGCFLDDRSEPYFLLQPAKVEVLSEDPFPVLVFHDAISDDQVEMMKEKIMEEGSLSPGQVMYTEDSGDEGQGWISTNQTQTTGWLSELIYPEMLPITRRLDLLTGLQLSFTETYSTHIESEPFQIGVYGPGGLYLCHNDYLSLEHLKWHRSSEEGLLWVGDRVATAMLYLSDVSGGRTVFPTAGVSAAPEKGSALFWFNLSYFGAEDGTALHGECPVVYGVKWVSNKWIREGSQMFKRPCQKMPSA